MINETSARSPLIAIQLSGQEQIFKEGFNGLLAAATDVNESRASCGIRVWELGF